LPWRLQTSRARSPSGDASGFVNIKPNLPGRVTGAGYK
jgi:hypothetical protein